MTRLARYRLGYLGALVGLGGAAVAIVAAADYSPLAILAVGLMLLAPGRLQGVLWRDFFRGTRLLREGRHAEAIAYLEGFRIRITQRPSLKRAIWLTWPGYTANADVMALTNLGAAQFGLGDLDAAERDLTTASALDPESPLPWLNLGLVRSARGDTSGAERAFVEARRHGYRGGSLDRIQQTASGLVTRLEGRGLSSDRRTHG